ncbi:MAG: hypothetical protein J6O51_04095 [Bacteroidales bacterium]|nr:hypothetical protein [Bacteroidales bacterium]
MELCLSHDFVKVLEFSRDEALRTGWHNICPDHIMLGILRHADNNAVLALESAGAVPDMLKVQLDEALFVSEQIPWEERESINLCDSAVSMLQHASLEAARCGASCIEPLHFLLACSRISGSYSHDWLDSEGISLRSLVEASGLPWAKYGLGIKGGEKEEGPDTTPDPLLMAAAIEKRIREGYGTENPHLS